MTTEKRGKRCNRNTGAQFHSGYVNVHKVTHIIMINLHINTYQTRNVVRGKTDTTKCAET